jgi:hypothetical protein
LQSDECRTKIVTIGAKAGTVVFMPNTVTQN